MYGRHDVYFKLHVHCRMHEFWLKTAGCAPWSNPTLIVASDIN